MGCLCEKTLLMRTISLVLFASVFIYLVNLLEGQSISIQFAGWVMFWICFYIFRSIGIKLKKKLKRYKDGAL
jgi:hypothetical protein